MKETTVFISSTIIAGLLAIPYLGFAYIVYANATVPESADHLDFGHTTLNRYRMSMDHHEDFPGTIGYVEPDQSLFSVAERYGLDALVRFDFLTYAMGVVDVRTAIEINGDVQLALNLANEILDRLEFHRSYFNDATLVFFDYQLMLIESGATQLQELLNNGIGSYMQNPDLIALIDQLLDQLFFGYASGLDTHEVGGLEELRIPEGTTDNEIYDLLIRRINRLHSHSSDDGHLLRNRPWVRPRPGAG